MGQGQASRLRDLPSVEQLATALDAPHPLAVAAARAAIDAARAALLEGADRDVDVLADAPLPLQRGEGLLEAVRVDPVDDLAEHLD